MGLSHHADPADAIVASEPFTEEPAVKCQMCSNDATVHLTDATGGQKRTIHLCQACAEQQNLLKQQELNLPAILETLIGQHLGRTDELARLTCPACGIKYMEFRAAGRLGCPHDYSAFREGLEPLLQRIHRSSQHRGKKPRHRTDEIREVELLELRQRLRKAVEEEQYEEASRLRDVLRSKEAMDESG